MIPCRLLKEGLRKQYLFLLLLSCSSGCHVLVRLGEPAPEATVEEIQKFEVDEQGQEKPSSDDELPPLPGTASKRRADRIVAYRYSRLKSNTGINTNTAIAPGEGQTVYRTQLRFLQSHSSPGAADDDVNLLVNPHLLAYGIREDLTLVGVVPIVFREGTARPPSPPGAFGSLAEQGVADLRFFGKYRFWEKDLPGETYRWSALGGVEVPTYDEPFSSDSWDPFLGTVWTYQSLEWGLDLDAVWQFNTGAGVFRHDALSYDLAYTYVLLTGQTLDEKFWQLGSVFELNGTYITDGSHLVYAAPGIQLALERMIVEASLQLPVVRDLKNAAEPDFTFVVGTRITW